MKTTYSKIVLFNLLAVAFLTSCGDDDTPQLINEEELITTVTYTLTNDADPNDIVVLESVDNDGEGPNPPVTTVSGALTANSVYSGDLRFLNESESPAENITQEVRAEAEEHEVFYTTSIASIGITKTDQDNDGNPLGLDTRLTTGAAGTGSLTIVLRHEPVKPNDNTLSGAGGETDAEVSFSVQVQ